MMMLIGEAWGFEEDIEKQPFVGASGRFLRAMLHEAHVQDFYLTNVFNLRPQGNDIKTLCTKNRALGIKGLPAIQRGWYLKKEHEPELLRLENEINTLMPDVIVGLGATALWFLAGKTAIASERGLPFSYKGIRAYATFHPAAVLRQYDLKTVLLLDLLKAEDCLPITSRETLVPETADDVRDWLHRFVHPADVVGCDIETQPSSKQITCIGFAPVNQQALVIPIWDIKTGKSYWSFEDEVTIWEEIREVCAKVPLVGQNFSYDMSYLWAVYGIPVLNFLGDTMLQHHTLQPEMRKSLGFLGSLYTETPSWKYIRKDEEKELD